MGVSFQPSASRTTSSYCLSDPTDESVGYYHSSARADWDRVSVQSHAEALIPRSRRTLTDAPILDRLRQAVIKDAPQALFD